MRIPPVDFVVELFLPRRQSQVSAWGQCSLGTVQIFLALIFDHMFDERIHDRTSFALQIHNGPLVLSKHSKNGEVSPWVAVYMTKF